MKGTITSGFRRCFMPAKHENSSSGTRPGSTPEGKPNSKGPSITGPKPGEENLAGYLMARAALHRKVEGPVLKNLRAGHATVREVGERLPLGRANVIEDIEKAGEPHLMLRNRALPELRGAMTVKGMGFFRKEPENAFVWRQAAAGLYAQTGTCGTFSVVAAPMHAAKLPGMKDKQAIVARASHEEVDHSWAEMIPKGMREDGTPILHGKDVILDAWGKEKVAILREDGGFSRLGPGGSQDHIMHEDILDHKSGPKALKAVNRFEAQIRNSSSLKAEFHSAVDHQVRSGVGVSDKVVYTATSVFSSDFRHEAGAALHKNLNKPIHDLKNVQEAGFDASAGAELAKRQSLPEIRAIGVARFLGSDIRDAQAKAAQIHRMSNLTSEIQAAGVARSLGSNVRSAKDEVPGIIASARELFPRTGSKEEGFPLRLA